MTTAIARSPLGEQVYLQILQRIQQGSVPPGSKLRDSAIAADLGVSRTPVREALLRLAREGLLAAEAGRGFASPLSTGPSCGRSDRSSRPWSPSPSSCPPSPPPRDSIGWPTSYGVGADPGRRRRVHSAR